MESDAPTASGTPTPAVHHDDAVMTEASLTNNANDEGMLVVQADTATDKQAEEAAIALATAAMLADLERRYIESTDECSQWKLQLSECRATLQEAELRLQQHQNTERTSNDYEHQLQQLQNKIVTYQEENRVVLERNDRMQAEGDALREEIRYVALLE
jgi:chromosome segregation ATPase